MNCKLGGIEVEKEFLSSFEEWLRSPFFDWYSAIARIEKDAVTQELVDNPEIDGMKKSGRVNGIKWMIEILPDTLLGELKNLRGDIDEEAGE